MDVESRHAFWSAMRTFAAGGKTILFATHYLEEADAYADRVVLVSHGQIVADGTAAQVKALVSGRTVRATVSGPDVAALQRLPGVETVEVRGDSVLIATTDSDAVARHLLSATAAHDLEITSRGLEDAFISLTAEEDQS
jgi:ABC-2 type transport system ATP-binding protein